MRGNIVRFLAVIAALWGIALPCPRPALADPLMAQAATSLDAAVLREIDTIQDESRRALEAFLRREPTPTACKAGFQLGVRRPFIIALSDRAEQAGLRRGDLVKSLAGLPIGGPDDMARAAARMSPTSLTDVVVERNGQEVTLPAPCAPEPDAWAAIRRALEAAAHGDWDTCQAAAVDIGRRRGFVSSNALELRAECALAQTALGGKRQSRLPLAKVVYEWRQAQIRESGYEPGRLDDVRSDILVTVTLLRQEGFAEYANDLEAQLRIAAQRAAQEE